MPANRLSRVCAFAAVFPGAAMALGLGDIRLNSSLNAPLDADIELIGATPDELASLKAQIASRDTFARYGLEWPAYLSSISLRPAKSTDGRDVLRLRSSESITEPFVTVLVEVNWARGRLVREYTVLLDPPVFTPGDKSSAPVTAPTTTAGTRSGAVERRPESPAPMPAPAPSRPAAAQVPAAPAPRPAARTPAAGPGPESAAGGDTYQVRAGDSLSGIAGRLAGGPIDDRRRWMVAAYRGNRQAFDGNMNLLRSGAVLRVPDSAAVSGIGADEAVAEIRRQAAEWRGAAPSATAAAASAEQPGRLRLVTPSAPGTGVGSAGTPGASGGGGALQSQVQELQKQLEESRRLLEMRSAELAQLQSRIAAASAPAATASGAATAAPGTAASAPGAAAPAAGSAAAPGAQAPAAPAPETPAGEAGAGSAAPAAAEPAAAAADAAKPAAESAAEPAKKARRPGGAAAQTPAAGEGSLLDTLKEFWWVIAALVAAVAGLFGYRAWRARQEEAFDDSLGRLASAGDSLPPFQPEAPVTRTSAPAASFLVEESAAREAPRAVAAGAAAAVAPKVQHVATDETISTEGTVNIDQGDPLAEADFHMAYGLYDQAADLIRIAIAREPERRDLRMKLLEVYFVWGNKDQFVQAAHDVAKTRFEAAPGEWEKVVIMGRQLAPEDPLFAGSAPTRGLASAGVDLNLEGGQNRVDFDVFGEPASSATTATEMALASSQDPTAESPALRSASRDVEFSVDSTGTFDLRRPATGETTRNMMPEAGRGGASLLAGFDAGAASEGPTVEQPALARAEPDFSLAATGTNEQPSLDATRTQEIGIDDLGFELSAIDATSPASTAGGSDAPTLLAGLDDHARKLIEEAEGRGGFRGAGIGDARGDSTAQLPALEDGGAASTAELPGLDPGLEPGLEDGEAGSTAELPGLEGGATGATAQLPALEDIDVDLSDDATLADNSPSRTARIDVSALAEAVGIDSTQRLSSVDLGLPDIESATLSEVGTKLDLARAYIDMGDPEGARSILGEVLDEGSDQQKAEAQRLIDSLPG